MIRYAAAWLAWSLAGLCVVAFVAAIVLYVLVRSAQGGSPAAGDLATVRLVLLDAPFLAFPLVGALISSRRPENPIGWVCLAIGLLATIGTLTQLYTAYGVTSPGSVPFVAAVVALTQWAWVLPVGLMGTYLLLLFPDGRPPSRRWRPLAWLCGVVIVLVGVTNVLAPGPLTDLDGTRNPFGIEDAPWLVNAAEAISLPFGACILASAVSLVVRYRHSGGVVREQIKWIALAASFVGTLLFLSIIYGFLILPEITTPKGVEWTPPPWFRFFTYALMGSVASIPVAIGFAVLRYRLYDIDIIINRTLVYGSLTGTLALVYFGGVTATQTLLRVLTDRQELPQFVVVASTLLIAALFTPLRRGIQAFIDRSFYRSKYDAAKTLEGFSTKLRNETDLQALSDDLEGVVRETMQPAHVSLWLRPETAPQRRQPG